MQVEILHRHQIILLFILILLSLLLYVWELEELWTLERVPGDDQCTCCLRLAIIDWSLLLETLRVCACFPYTTLSCQRKWENMGSVTQSAAPFYLRRFLREDKQPSVTFYLNFIAQKCLVGRETGTWTFASMMTTRPYTSHEVDILQVFAGFYLCGVHPVALLIYAI
jgi:hypothetical protein